MRAVQTAIVALLAMGISTSAFAGDLQDAVAKAARQNSTPSTQVRSSKSVVRAGAALFAGGMAVGLFSFINNQNGPFSEFGEANAVNKPLGAAGLGAAFAGGVLIFLGTHMSKAPAVTVGAGQVTVSKRLSW